MWKKPLPKGKTSFYDWCIKNKRQDILNRWNYKLNQCSPKEITFRSQGINRKGYWFNCPKHLHKPELKRIIDFTKRNDGKLACHQCNSIGQYILDIYGKNGLNLYWDFEKNNISGLNPFELSKGSIINKIWIKCQYNSYHGSYSISCNNFHEGNRCPYCNSNSGKVHPLDSLGQYIVDNYGQEFLDKIWSDKNKKSAFEYNPTSKDEVWWKCPEGKHKDYYRKINNSYYYNFRCPKCIKEKDSSIIQKNVKNYLNSLGFTVLHETKCTIIPINPKTKYPLPFDNEIELINKKRLICEVNGIQHYELNGFHKLQAKRNNTTPEYEFHYQKLKDRYKRFIAYKKGYEYLVIPYWTDDENETWKKLINNKIELLK